MEVKNRKVEMPPKCGQQGPKRVEVDKFVDDLELPGVNVGAATHMLFALLTVGCILLFVWVWLGKLDVVSVASGEVTPMGQIKKVQHLEGGIVSEIMVREGDRVERGQALINLEATARGADVDEMTARLIALRLDISRLEAEADALKKPGFPEDLTRNYSELVSQVMNLFEVRKSRHESNVQSQQKLVNQRWQDIRQVKTRQANAKENLKFINEQVKISEELLKDDLTNRYNHLSLLREQTSLEGRIKEDTAALARAKAGLEEAKEDLKGLSHAFKEESRKNLEKKRREYKELSQRSRKYRDQLKRTVLHAPVDGIVKSLYVFAVGEVIKPGATVVDIVPENDSLIIEALLPPGDIGFIETGQTSYIKLASSDAVRFEKLKGTVIHISPDTFTSSNGLSYYKINIEPERDYFQGGKWQYQLQPGVQVSVSILIGQRTILEYVLGPILDSCSVALSER